ncbi:MAG: bifunctional hydroxymethylpyrimidine kinase/phosphomethylpyrimidine kinase [Proteobacteria bacterium]|nr:bifunctional hydroxymethylpyrimidine kinase/phosphomethylpyrimidine kinase [Pseudomonadota bacterium]MBU4294891.1 bifunctional hydroxymethylpyrimidine kinase/phosphomethylpyrimidine kinase [Pseudomonadota bacterium]MCG2750124.1 bifunctional hydroxymethylpyrimidine kinase/phosphomethylpyrimidine kinase [Desulfobulbaceae bacterium]
MVAMNPHNNRPMALSIAGSDPSGGAGIQADIKTFTVIGVYCGAAITALTSQNTLGVSSYLALPAAFVKKQIQDVLDDLNVTHIKIGMVGNQEIAQAIGEVLTGFAGEVIYDPVIKSSGGVSLFAASSMAVTEHIISHATVLTPNIAELEIITGKECDNAGRALAAAQGLLALSPRLKAVCVKGGHMNVLGKTVTDYLVQKTLPGKGAEEPGFHISSIDHPRIFSRNTHGTGCTFASALTAYHMRTDDLSKAFSYTCAFMDTLLNRSASHSMGHGTGPLLHHYFLRQEDDADKVL